MNSNTNERWLPIWLIQARSEFYVRWMDFGSTPLDDPFVGQTISKLLAKKPRVPERVTTLKGFLTIAAEFPPTDPAGIIFHISRCGSTLISNVLRTAEESLIVSEAPLFTSAGLWLTNKGNKPGATEWAALQAATLKAIVTTYSHHGGTAPAKVIIKSHAIGILHISTFRRIWPNIPFLIVIRDPSAVVVSNIESPGGWVSARLDPRNSLFPWSDESVINMPVEDYCARGIGSFCESARINVGDMTRVMDYDQMSRSTITEVGEWFGLKVPPMDSSVFEEVFKTYSKDPTRSKEFTGDVTEKRASSSGAIRTVVEEWAQKPYEALRASSVGMWKSTV